MSAHQGADFALRWTLTALAHANAPVSREQDYLCGSRVQWEWVLPRPGPRPVFDEPQCITERVNSQAGYSQPQLVLTIGAPGSGKTTWARYKYGRDAVVAADDWFERFNGGQYDVKRIGDAHRWCQDQVRQRLFAGQSAVANNTNTTLAEMFEYVAAVEFGGLPHAIVFARMPEQRPAVLEQRTKHGVPLKKIKQMVQRMQRMGSPSISRVLAAGRLNRIRRLPTRVLYIGVFFSPETCARIHGELLAAIEAQSPESKAQLLKDVTNCHITAEFGPTAETVRKTPVGKEVDVQIVGWISHARLQLVTIKMGDECGVHVTNVHPHVTISTNGVPPVTSNTALQYIRPQPFRAPFYARGVVKLFLGGGKTIDDLKELPPGWDGKKTSRSRSPSPHRRGGRSGIPRRASRSPRRKSPKHGRENAPGADK